MISDIDERERHQELILNRELPPVNAISPPFFIIALLFDSFFSFHCILSKPNNTPHFAHQVTVCLYTMVGCPAKVPYNSLINA